MDRVKLDALFESNAFDAVMHFAAFTEVGESVIKPAKYYQNNFSNTQNLLDTMVSHGVNRFIFSSNAAVFGGFKQRGRDIASEYWMKWYLLSDSLSRNRTDGSLVRLTTPIAPGESELDAENRLNEFLSIADPMLDTYVPI